MCFLSYGSMVLYFTALNIFYLNVAVQVIWSIFLFILSSEYCLPWPQVSVQEQYLWHWVGLWELQKCSSQTTESRDSSNSLQSETWQEEAVEFLRQPNTPLYHTNHRLHPRSILCQFLHRCLSWKKKKKLVITMKIPGVFYIIWKQLSWTNCIIHFKLATFT